MGTIKLERQRHPHNYQNIENLSEVEKNYVRHYDVSYIVTNLLFGK